MWTSRAVFFASLISYGLFYLARGDGSDTDYQILHRSSEWRLREDRLFLRSGVCSSENKSRVDACSSHPEPLNSLHALRRTNCFCDDSCHVYHDCCIDFVLPEDRYTRRWTCREVVGKFRFPIYVLQSCSLQWDDGYTRRLCEVESSVLEHNREQYSYLQDIPIKSERTGVFYRNVFCALCNNVRDILKWVSYLVCFENSSKKVFKRSELDFTSASYDTRTQKFKKVKMNEKLFSCRVVVEDFKTYNHLTQHGARLCKPMIDTCPHPSDEVEARHCGAYASFVYESGLSSNQRVYKNFHCALCNNASIDRLKCVDPLYPPLYTTDLPSAEPSLSFLFDFNFDGGGNQVGSVTPCKVYDGKIWDPVLKECINFTCGKLFERKGSECVPIDNNKTFIGALNDSCPKMILKQGEFHVFENESVFINDTGIILSASEYEVHELSAQDIVSIIVCVDEGSFLMQLSKIQYYLSEITLSLSIICLILHLVAYSVLKDLQNCPGKILMSLSACLLCGHVFLLVGPHLAGTYWMCYVCGVLMHSGYLSSFLWMSVMAYDIYRTFSITQSRNSMHKKTFLKYSAFCWTIAISITTVSVLYDNLSSENDPFRPKYGNPICWFNQRRGVLVFFILPIFALLVANAVLFSVSAFRINRISQQTKMVGNFSDRVRYFLYIKLSIVFGLTWVLGFLAGLLKVDVLWYLFIILNGLQGVFIFISFTVKRKIMRKLLIKFKVKSQQYRFSKDSSGLKKTMYSSLSNLSSLQTTLTAHLPALEENPGILKAVRKINPDTLIKHGKM